MFEKEAEEYVIKKHHIDKTKLPIDFSLRCEFSDDLKVALEYMEDHEAELDGELLMIKPFLTKFVREGGLSMLQAINFMLFQKEKNKIQSHLPGGFFLFNRLYKQEVIYGT